jgi:hypothetical protein
LYETNKKLFKQRIQPLYQIGETTFTREQPPILPSPSPLLPSPTPDILKEESIGSSVSAVPSVITGILRWMATFKGTVA